ncbi:O-antigen/teichoic acid export membrane protein [Stella humosa]|uniref:O-antigen/teichoic acid export membrane protein n=1 Tax=Stella humosa TaxID=94 RepID=A0A3N1MC39_9PROT|nr:lipopolysaccharide biosynthesis protein [Stella humosa]ROQ00320.1 O-antigen/teichoic acid export membrane protein [Stella humosa]BBK30441.1 teichoic acid transporter [Stella humosa]
MTDEPATAGAPSLAVARRGMLRGVLANASVLLAGKSVGAVLSLAYMALAARTLGIEQFGVLILIHAFAQTVSEISKFQSWQAIIHYGTVPLREGRLGDFRRLLRFSLRLDLYSAIAGMLLGVAGAAWLGPWLGWTPAAVPAAMLYTTSVAFMVAATPTGVLRLVDRFDLMAVQGNVASLVRLVGAGFAFVLGGDLLVFLAVWYGASLLSCATLFGCAWQQLGRRGWLAAMPAGGPRGAAGFPGLWKFVWTTNLNSTLNIGFKQLTVLMIGAMLGAREAALFRVARQVGDAIAKPARLLVPALYPELADLWASRKLGDLRRLVFQVGVIAAVVALVLVSAVLLTAAPALRLVMGPEFEAGAAIMVWVVAAAAVGVAALPFEPLLISVGEASAALVIRAVTIALYLPAALFLVDRYGLTGAGAGILGGALLLFACQFAAVLRWHHGQSGGGRGRPRAAGPGE